MTHDWVAWYSALQTRRGAVMTWTLWYDLAVLCLMILAVVVYN